MKSTLILLVVIFSLILFSCKKEEVITTPPPPPNPTISEVNPINIDEEGFEFLDKIKGHWIGSSKVMSWEWDWFAFDFRPTSSSHIFAMYEGGSLGNLFTSFFIADFKGTKTIMARNGGVLSGIYRTSYFVLDDVKTENGADYFRFVDAIGGEETMYMELSFSGDDLIWNAYTSRLGENALPTKHFSFNGSKEHLHLADNAAANFNFPQNTLAWDFSNGFNEDYLYVLDGEEETKSASFLAQATTNDVFSLAIESGDPFKIQDYPNIGLLNVNIDRSSTIQDKKLFVYLSFNPLTDANGYFLAMEEFNSVLLFPDIAADQNEFLFTYLHPGDYYITIIADMNDDGFPGMGDITHPSQAITINPNGQHQITIDNINTQN